LPHRGGATIDSNNQRQAPHGLIQWRWPHVMPGEGPGSTTVLRVR